MATFNYSAIANGGTQAFDPAVDVLHFNQLTILPHDVFVSRDEDAGGSSALDLNVAVIDGPLAGKHIFLLDMEQKEMTTSNFTFAAGGSIFVGDNTTATTADDSANTHVGTASNDLFVGLGGNDTMSGGGGDDVFAFYLGSNGSYGMDSIDGGGGTDTLRFLDQGSVGASANLVTGVVSGGDDAMASGASVSGIEFLAGTIFDDNFIGNTGGNMLIGRDGDDTLRGGGGSDTLEGGIGDDRLIGGEGRDWADYQHAESGVNLRLASGGADGDGGTDLLNGMEDFIGSGFADRVVGTVDGNVFDLRAGSDNVRGGGGEDTLFGGTGSDRLSGDGGRDLMFGGLGNDVLVGGAAVDTLVGSGSSAFVDGATASAGRDTFRFDSATGGRDLIFAFDTDTVGGADSNVDVIDLRALFDSINYIGTNPIADGYLRVTNAATNEGSQNRSDSTVWVDVNGGGDSWTAIAQVVDVSRATLLGDPDFFTFQ